MSVLEGVLREEAERTKKNTDLYKEILAKLPRGTIFVRKMHKGSFVYRKRKENGKVVSEYLGPFNSLKAKKEIERSMEYKRVKENIANAKKEYKHIMKMLKEYERK